MLIDFSIVVLSIVALNNKKINKKGKTVLIFKI